MNRSGSAGGARERTVVNLGCGDKASPHPHVVNVDWSIYLRFRSNPLLSWLPPLVLDAGRRQRYLALPRNIVAHDIACGLPFADASIDVVYHSHMLEHLDRPRVPGFLAEVRRVLKPGGVHRIVVPDLEQLARQYLEDLARRAPAAAEWAGHDARVAEIIEQSVRREAAAARSLTGLRRRLYTLVFGDARRRGETHQWLYDRVNLGALLLEAGYRDIAVEAFDSSRIGGWSGYGLDTDAAGRQYKPGSLYLEAAR
jgi:SAM-dependent methyltransferase